MKRDERIRAMDALKHDPGCEVLLVSLKAGGVGLNLTAAQRVYLMDPYWNPAVENQAVDRIVSFFSYLCDEVQWSSCSEICPCDYLRTLSDSDFGFPASARTNSARYNCEANYRKLD